MMRRKSERNKAKPSPEAKPEKPKRGRPSRKRKKSSSSEKDSANEDVVQDAGVVVCQITPETPGTATPEKVQSHSDDENVDQVWHVKASESSEEAGEKIQKLKICLSRPSSTPERPDRSPRGRRKLNRSTSQLDFTNEVPVEDKRKTRHRSRRGSTKDVEGKDSDTPDIESPSAKEIPSNPIGSEGVKETHNEPDKNEHISITEKGNKSVIDESRTNPNESKSIQSSGNVKDTNDDSNVELVISVGSESVLENKIEVDAPEIVHKDLAEVKNTVQPEKATDPIVTEQASKVKDVTKKTEDTIENTENVIQKADVTTEKTKDPIKDSVEKTKDTIDKTKDVIIKKVENIPERTKKILEKDEDAIKKNVESEDQQQSGQQKDIKKQPKRMDVTKIAVKIDDVKLKEIESPKIVEVKSTKEVIAHIENTKQTIAKNADLEKDVSVGKRSIHSGEAVKKSSVSTADRDPKIIQGPGIQESGIKKQQIAQDAVQDNTVSTVQSAESVVSNSDLSDSKKKQQHPDDKESADSKDSDCVKPTVNKKKKLESDMKTSVCKISEDVAIEDSATDTNVPESTTITPKPVQPNQKVSLEVNTTVDSSKIETPAETGNVTGSNQRKRRWGSRTSKTSKAPIVSISTDSLKNLISHVEPVSVEEVLLDVKVKSNKETRPPKKVSSEDTGKTNGKYNVLDKGVVEKEIIGSMSHRKISIVSEETPKAQRPPSPPKCKISSILYITNLVRPFTILQLKNTLQRTGRIVENGFWIDKIKSRCFVQFENEDQAFETRHALHGVKWPTSNPKTLNVDFGSKSNMDEALAAGEDDKPIGQAETWIKDQHTRDSNSNMENEKGTERKIAIREWDLGKGETKDLERDRSERQLIRSRDGVDLERRKRRSKSRSPSPARKFKKKEEEAPSKLLDDLFKKTKTTPCIYWLPLNAETILIKEEQRRKHMAEHERRLEELRRATEEQRVPRHAPHTTHHGTVHRHR